MIRHQRRFISLLMCVSLVFGPGSAFAQDEDEDEEEEVDQSEMMIAVSADVIEISGSISKDIGFSWAPFTTGINFAEKAPIPGWARQSSFEVFDCQTHKAH